MNLFYKINGRQLVSGVVLAAALLTVTSCKDEVDLPMPIIRLNTESITAPSLMATFNVEVESNCDWKATTDASNYSWLDITEGKSVGNGELRFSLKPNDSASAREAIIEIGNEQNTATAKLRVSQNPGSGDGVVTISELRTLAGTSGFQLPEDAVIHGVVVSNMQNANFPSSLLALEGSAEAGNGIAVRTSGNLLIGTGEELEVKLHKASLNADPETGVLVLEPENDDAIVRTETTTIVPIPVEVSIPELLTGDYESMLVKLSGQISSTDISKEYLYEVSAFIDEDKNSLPMKVLSECKFAESAIPTGSGSIVGVMGADDEGPAIYPSSLNEMNLVSTRFDGGFMLPYIVSLMTNTATNCDGRYIAMNATESEITKLKDFNGLEATTTDGFATKVTWKLSTASNYFRYWTDNSGHHNFQLGSWMDGQDNYILFEYPTGMEFTDGFRLQFGWAGQKDAPRHWEVLYSTDGETWSHGKESTVFTLPKGVVGTAGKGYSDFTVDVYLDKPITKEDHLSIKIRRADNEESVSGGAIVAASGRGIFHSCMLIDNLPAKTVTSSPSGAVYFEPFDGLTEGADYRLGDKLSALLNYDGSDISEWESAVSRNLTGSNVRQRPGYAQIGYVNTINDDHTAYKNIVGELITPALNVNGTYTLSFKAMAYKNKAVHVAAVKDKDGDFTQGVIEILNGGTINGQSKVTFGPMSYDAFKAFGFTVEGVTPKTQIKFTSAPAGEEYTRWFIDNICLK